MRSFDTKPKKKKKGDDTPTLHIVDGSNWMCRAYFATQHAVPYLTAPDGTPTGGIKQFLNMVETLYAQTIREETGSFIAICFDPSSSDTWRYRAIQQWVGENSKKFVRAVYVKSADYKGNRDRTKTSDLPIQMELSRKILDKAGFWICVKAPYEADDVVGTLSHRFSNMGYKVKLYSRDKDYVQLVDNPNVELIMQKQANAPERRFTHKNVEEFVGVPANRITHYLALAGDNADNVPGVPGIADGYAAKFIREYGSIKKFCLAAKTIKSTAKWKKALTGELPMMDLALQLELVTIDRNVPGLPKELEAFRVKESDDKYLKKMKKRLALRSIFHI
ncbi:exonuclease [Yersinia phage fHe-Yen9-02]|nr:exonuclease [Yersinia phage fHe-Yen9-02]